MNKLYRAINEIDDDLIERAGKIPSKKVIPLKKIIAVAAGFAIFVGSISVFNHTQYGEIDLTDRIEITESVHESSFESIGASGTTYGGTKIEGIITDVDRSGLRFQLDHKTWIVVTDDTIIGKACKSEEEKNSLLIEPTFRVGNYISGSIKDENATTIEAYGIDINWNWENPIKP